MKRDAPGETLRLLYEESGSDGLTADGENFAVSLLANRTRSPDPDVDADDGRFHSCSEDALLVCLEPGNPNDLNFVAKFSMPCSNISLPCATTPLWSRSRSPTAARGPAGSSSFLSKSIARVFLCSSDLDPRTMTGRRVFERLAVEASRGDIGSSYESMVVALSLRKGSISNRSVTTVEIDRSESCLSTIGGRSVYVVVVAAKSICLL